MSEQLTELRFQVGEAWKGTYSSTTTYSKAAVVQDSTGLSIYRSLKSGNAGHALTDTSWWFCIIDLSSIKTESDRIAALNTAIAADEAARVSNETTRQGNEATRQSNESTRASQETARQTAESSRSTAESARQTAETARANAETTRGTNETTRQGNETTRQSNETSRVSAETTRQSNETARVEAEEDRADAESARATAETARASAETARDTAEGERDTAETSRNTAEAAREAQSAADHTQAASDHTTAASDHTTAAADHTQAGTDHTASEAATSAANTAAAAATAAAGTANTAAEAADDAREAIQDDLAQKANKDGYYSTLTAGAAENLVGDTEEESTFTTQMTGGEVEFGSGAGQLTKVQGNGLAWNQLVGNPNFANSGQGWTLDSGSVTYSDAEALVTASVQNTRIIQRNVSLIKDHIYYISSIIQSGDNNTKYVDVSGGLMATTDGTTRKQKVHLVGKWTAYTGDGWAFGVRDSAESDFQQFSFSCPVLIDLSLIYGLGNEPNSVDVVEADLAKLIAQKPYYQPNAGELFGTKVLHLISYGQNLLNPANGQARLAPYSYESVVNKYGIAAKAGVTLGTITFTPDATGVAETITPDSNGQFTISGAGTLNVAVSAGNLADVYVWAVYDGAKDGIENYVPFQQDAIEIKAGEVYGKLNGAGEYVQVFADGVMRATGILPSSIRDLVDVAGKTAKVNCGSIDLGSIRWIKDTSFEFFYAYQFSDFKRQTDWTKNFYCVSTKYAAMSGLAHNQGNTGIFSNDNTDSLRIKDPANFDKTAQQFGEYVSGVIMWYALKTPLQYTDLKLSSDGGQTFRDLPTSIVVDNWGVWQQKPSEGLTPATGHDFEGIAATISTILPMDAVEILKSVQDNGIMTSDQRAQLTNILTALQTAGIIGSFTIAETPTDKVFPITVTAPTPAE